LFIVDGAFDLLTYTGDLRIDRGLDFRDTALTLMEFVINETNTVT